MPVQTPRRHGLTHELWNCGADQASSLMKQPSNHTKSSTTNIILASWSLYSQHYNLKYLHFFHLGSTYSLFPIDSIIWSSLPPLFVSECGCGRKAARGSTRAGTRIHLWGDTIVGTQDGFLLSTKNGRFFVIPRIFQVVGGRSKDIIV